MALSARIGYIVPSKIMLQQKVTLTRNVTIVSVGNTYNKTITIKNSSIWSSMQKISQ